MKDHNFMVIDKVVVEPERTIMNVSYALIKVV